MSELHGSIGPTRNYENLTNLPSINDVKVVGNLTPSDLGLADDASVEEIRSALENKVDKVTGKGLSENDYTDGEKAKLEGIETGAEKNVQSDWNASDGSDAFIKNKPSVLETVTIRGTATTKSGTNTDLDVYKTAEVDSAIDVVDNKIDTNVADLDERKAEIDGCYEGLTSGMAMGLVTDSVVEDKEPYNFRSLAHLPVGRFCYDTIVGGSVVWNQLFPTKTIDYTGTDNTVTSNNDGKFVVNLTVDVTGTSETGNITSLPASTFTVNHVYLLLGSKGGVSIRLKGYEKNANSVFKATTAKYNNVGMTYNNVSVGTYTIYPQLIDLTAALPSAIADYIYSLETATAGAGVAWFKKYFPKEYYGYAEPRFEHVQTSAKETVGFNQWDEEWESGYFNLNTGQPVANTSISRSKNFIDALPNTVYYYHNGNEKNHTLLYYDSEKNYISHTLAGATSHEFTTPANTRYMKFGFVGTTYNHDICINLHGDRDGEYEPYRKRTYPLDSSLTLRGIPKLDSANMLYFDGDIYEHDGTVTRRCGIVDLGTLNYSKTDSGLFTSGTLTERIKPAGSPNSPAEGIFCGLYPTVVSSGSHAGPQGTTPSPDMTMSLNAYGTLYFNNTSYTDATAFKTAMSGVYLLYALKTPTTETAEPFQSPMVVDPLGTEEFVDYGVTEGDRDVAIPVGHDSQYPEDLVKKTEKMPSPTGTNGDYVITEVDGKLYLKPYVPAVGLTAPTSEGEGE